MQLQQEIAQRLAEVAFADADKAQLLARQIAEVATRGKSLTESLLPLFLQLPSENEAAISKVAMAMKVELEELHDTLNDLQHELPEWTDFFLGMSNRS